MDTLFTIEPTKPTKLQAARRALEEAEHALLNSVEIGDSYTISHAQRAVNRFAELVKAEELAELNNSKQQP
jgi:hypothetical protein